MPGRMSTGVRTIASGPTISRTRASTTKVYGRLSAMRTIHMRIDYVAIHAARSGDQLALAARLRKVSSVTHRLAVARDTDGAGQGR